MDHNELRALFLGFFEKKKHKSVTSSPVIPYQDPTLMFTNAGMNQFKEVLAGNETRSYNRAASVQKCIRVSGKHNDFEIVGFDGSHHTFFEMLGNWSFGDYYKKEAIEWAWEFLTGDLKLDKKKLAVSIYKGDEESYDIWKNVIKIPKERIVRLGDIENGDEENFWSMGDTGPCGFCTEIHYNESGKEDKHISNEILEKNYVELWNLVFMEFYRDANGKLTPLKNKNVDTGMGFERLYAIIQNKRSNYHTDLFTPLMDQLEKLSGKKYGSLETSFQVIADHIRALTFAIGDGGHFSNEGRGYVLRKILRRASRHSKKIGIEKPVLYQLVDTVIKTMGKFYTDLEPKKENIKKFIRIEEEKFLTTLDKGLDQLAGIIKKIKK
ncbi:MAG: alanine--tRNA ligase, partial [Spirochaetes bacterium]|nr:alanine--tRNA ligase [Spirochaetota bacterium]